MPDAAPQYLRPYLRALWRQAPALGLLPAARAKLGEGLLLLPAAEPHASPPERRQLHLATAAHAGAHVRFGRARFERGSLKPMQVALLGLLEDARVEWHAASELPGLRPLWLGQHRPPAELGDDFESLLLRLSRSLLDPGCCDPGPWIRKARRLFFAHGDGSRLADLGPQQLRQLASRLGNDIGQMRLQFNARSYVVEPAYRDDNAHLWEADPDVARAPQEVAAPAPPASGPPPESIALEAEPGFNYPEWDRLIGRLRQGWVTVREREPAIVTPVMAREAQRLQAALASETVVARRLRRLVAAADAKAPAASRRLRAEDGDDFHLDTLVGARIAQRLGRTPDPRIHLRPIRTSGKLSVVIMLDASASTARVAGARDGKSDGDGDGDADGNGNGNDESDRDGRGKGASEGKARHSVLQASRLAALLLAVALEEAGHECALHGFSSNGRHQVMVHRVKRFGQACSDPLVMARAQALKSRWSTRLGAIVRHAAAAVRRRDAQVRMVLLVTDGEPYDVDVHDRRYLVHDLRQAVRESGRQGVQVACINLGAVAASEPVESLRNLFPRGAYREASGLDDFPHCAAAVMRSVRFPR